MIISVLSKLSADNPAEWHRYVGVAQQFMNSSPNRSIGMTPFELLVGKAMRLKEDLEFRTILEKEMQSLFQQERSQLRDEAKANIAKIQEENRRYYNRHRKKASVYTVGDTVAIRRTQGGPSLKLYAKYLGPYRITTRLRGDRYLVEKVGNHDGPHQTSTSADHMKAWPSDEKSRFAVSDFDADSTDDDTEDGVRSRMTECGTHGARTRRVGKQVKT